MGKLNTKFKLGKVSFPVPGMDEKVEIEGLETSVEGLDLSEYFSVLKQVPGIMKEMKAVLEEESTPSADPLHDFFSQMAQQADDPFAPGFKDGQMVDTPFGKGIVKATQIHPGHPLYDTLMKMKEEE